VSTGVVDGSLRPRVAVLDYRRGNLRSVENAILQVGGDPVRVVSGGENGCFDAAVLPGVGAFGDCVANLREHGLDRWVLDWISQDKPFLGICVGYQLLFEGSEESPGMSGLGVFSGSVRKFPVSVGKIPHMGWNTLGLTENGSLFGAGLSSQPYVYFVHSYYPEPAEDSHVAAWCEYGGIRFAAASCRRNIWATQFHPEKSQKVGLALLRNFLESSRHAFTSRD